MSTNPYATPKAAVADEPVQQGEYVPGGKSVPAANGWAWIADGWTLFKAAPGLWIGITVVFTAILFAMALVPFAGMLGQYLLMPVFMAGIVLGCRAIDEGGSLEFNHLFAGFQTRFGTLAAVGGLYLAGFVVVLVVVMLITGVGVFAVMAGGGQDVATTGAVLGLLLAVLIAVALSVPLLMAVWFAPPLVVFHDLGAVEAMKASFTGCLRNMLPFLVYGIVAMVLLFVAMLPLLLGLLVAGPVVLASVYTSYRDIYLR
jgi:uncharacterized membrane protein